ncbi:MAG: TetR/AcrR family transcriptional regulator [Solirubrobacteraceae bacterium]
MASISARSRLARVERMEQTLGVAHGLFAERGYAAVTMEEVAGAVGVTKPLLYNYFGNKERLYIACMERAGDALLVTIAEAVKATASPGEALGAGLGAFFDFLDADRAAWAVLFDETLPRGGEVAARVGVYRGRILELVSEAILGQLPARRRGGARIEVQALSVAVLGAAEALARWWLASGAISASDAAALLISTLEPGLGLRSGAAVAGGTAPEAGGTAPEAGRTAAKRRTGPDRTEPKGGRG